MFGNRVLSKGVLKTTEEGVKQFKLLTEELTKLSKISGKAWCLTEAKLFDKVRRISFGQGAVFGAAATGIITAIRKRKKKDKN